MSDRIEEVRVRFEEDTASHKMSINHDADNYRHLRFRAPKTGTYYYDLVTWPGHLAIVGDAGSGYVFSRIRDMFEFFRADQSGINPHYWSEKLVHPAMRDSTLRYSPDITRARLSAWHGEQVDTLGLNEHEAAKLRADLDEQVVGQLRDLDSHENAVRLMVEFECRMADFHDHRDRVIRIGEPYFWDLRDWDHQFLWACWAIATGIDRYDAHHEADHG